MNPLLKNKKQNKLLIILGPTAVGKSNIAVRLARKYNGEVISADSRQVYKGLDIGTGKITHAEMEGIPHHLLDVAETRERFTVTKWKELTTNAIRDIHSRNRLPIICGGTGYYIQALVYDIDYPEVPNDIEEQARLEKQSPEDLYIILQKLDQDRASTIDRMNKRRLSRAILIARKLGKVPVIDTTPKQTVDSKSDYKLVGITLPIDELRVRIHNRLVSRIDAGMIDEAKKLNENGLSYERMNELGLEYRYEAQYLQGQITKEGMIEKLDIEISHYAKRQMTWFKRDKNIDWYAPDQLEIIETSIKKYLLE
ncbi:MAG: tRNA (adenosine(37)-N6)-dimethylallyltransferase MiaA [Candidatus Taylorbacteria bacterium]